MAQGTDSRIIDEEVRRYIQLLRDNRVAIWRLYLFGSHASGRAHAESDIDLAVFWDKDDIEGFDEDILLMRLTREVDLGIEPHSFSRKDFENPDPFVKEIISTGRRLI